IGLKVIITMVLIIVLLSTIFYVWTGEIDVRKTVTGPLSSIIKFKKRLSLVVDIQQVSIARFGQAGKSGSGNFGIIFYGLQFVNTIDESVTVKSILLRYSDDKGIQTDDSHVLITGTVPSPQGPSESIVVKIGPANLVLMNWRNMRVVIGEY